MGGRGGEGLVGRLRTLLTFTAPPPSPPSDSRLPSPWLQPDNNVAFMKVVTHRLKIKTVMRTARVPAGVTSRSHAGPGQVCPRLAPGFPEALNTSPGDSDITRRQTTAAKPTFWHNVITSTVNLWIPPGPAAHPVATRGTAATPDKLPSRQRLKSLRLSIETQKSSCQNQKENTVLV